MLRTNRTIEYRAAPYGYIATIPKGTEVYPANNLPESGQYWVDRWAKMSAGAESWDNNHGFLIDGNDVDDDDDYHS